MTAHSLFDMYDPTAFVGSHNRGVGQDVRLGIVVNNTRAALPGERSREPWEKSRAADLEAPMWRARQEQMLTHLKELKAANQKLEMRNREVEHQLISLSNQLLDNRHHQANHFPGGHSDPPDGPGVLHQKPTHETGNPAAVAPKEKRRTSVDAELLTKLDEIMEKNLEEADFTVHKMCRMMHLSHMQFIRKVKQLTGRKPIDLLKSFRLNRAKKLLLQSNLTVAQIAYKVGYDMPNSFSRAFRQEFGISPTEYTGG